MSLNDTPGANRINIGFFGRRNAGKSSLVNAVTDQETAVVSDVEGTTTDPVSKAMELLPLGPVLITDTPGFDDTGELGQMRVKRTKRVLASADMAVLVSSAKEGLCECDRELIELFREREIPYIIAYNKCDRGICVQEDENSVCVSALDRINIDTLKEKMASLIKTQDKKIVGDLIKKKDFVVLVTPIDESAPKGRMILPQVQTIRDILDAEAITVTARETELAEVLAGLAAKPALVICDSQVFKMVSKIVPEDIPLTSFSILMARYKGFLKTAVAGAAEIKNLRSGDKVLISEGCTHHRQCNDIGVVKLPKWISAASGVSIEFETSSGKGFPEDLTGYALIVHCGGCMLSEREMMFRMREAQNQGVPVTNYGTAIAYSNGILKRSLEIFPELAAMLEE